MNITSSHNDQLMVHAAHRYSLGRMSYIVGCCIEWLKEHWSQLTENTQEVIVRDTIEAIERNQAGMDYDKEQWKQFVKWALENISDKQCEWIHHQLRWIHH